MCKKISFLIVFAFLLSFSSLATEELGTSFSAPPQRSLQAGLREWINNKYNQLPTLNFSAVPRRNPISRSVVDSSYRVLSVSYFLCMFPLVVSSHSPYWGTQHYHMYDQLPNWQCPTFDRFFYTSSSPADSECFWYQLNSIMEFIKFMAPRLPDGSFSMQI